MMPTGVRVSSVGLLVCFLSQPPAATCAGPPDGCAAGGIRAAANEVRCESRCVSRAARRGGSLPASCLTNCATRWDISWAALVKRGCARRMDRPAVATRTGALLADIRNSLPPGEPSSCAAARYRHAGVMAYCALRCEAGTANRGSDHATKCATRCTTRFTERCDTAERSGDCSATDTCTCLGTTIDSFVDDLVAAVLAGPTPTTTSTTIPDCPACNQHDRNGDGLFAVACVGDSNTGGLAWLARTWCWQLPADWDARNYALPGLLAADAAGRVDTALAETPDVVVLALGTNDIGSGRSAAETVAAIMALRRTVIDRCSMVGPHRLRPRSVIMGVPPTYAGMVDAATAEARTQLALAVNEALRALVPTEYIDSFTGFGPTSFFDGTHFTTAGQAVRAARVVEHLTQDAN